jgi:uncharacterized membrane protein SirB2
MTIGLDISNALDPFRIPVPFLLAIDSRAVHIALQPYQFLIRAVHVLSISLFFGAITVLDLRLLGAANELPLKPLARLVLPWVYATFALSMVTGIILFLYDPLEVGSHDWLTPKLLFIALAFANAVWFNTRYLPGQMISPTGLTTAGKAAGLASIMLWGLVILCACLNAEPPPRLLIGS